MYGGYYGKQQPIFGNKGIGCLECEFSMYGTERIKTWTEISATVNVGDNQFTVMETTDWAIGESIVIASTSFDHHEAEERVITAVSGNTFTVDKAFKFKHFSGEETYGTHKLIMRAEVAVLNRNIKVTGEPNSIADDYGAHVLMAGDSEDGLKSTIAFT